MSSHLQREMARYTISNGHVTVAELQSVGQEIHR